jgi:hypothetical protein
MPQFTRIATKKVDQTLVAAIEELLKEVPENTQDLVVVFHDDILKDVYNSKIIAGGRSLPVRFVPTPLPQLHDDSGSFYISYLLVTPSSEPKPPMPESDPE